ncbi:hypothetical protein C0Q70_02548 [Pomacea canaliculata]|uniref:Uncharacterized protein n=1 Tax=Pomacea canaliculata TaxID=400727 RepID=A0A2T7PQ98_POMCA|nr:hypothetical protein C0Q70_02548 [Pomacea canaliculata]
MPALARAAARGDTPKRSHKKKGNKEEEKSCDVGWRKELEDTVCGDWLHRLLNTATHGATGRVSATPDLPRRKRRLVPTFGGQTQLSIATDNMEVGVAALTSLTPPTLDRLAWSVITMTRHRAAQYCSKRTQQSYGFISLATG